jgi:predicted nucleotidyltransferase
MNKAAEKEIKRIVAIIAKKHQPEKIYLFGSFAWGKPRRDSDLDFLVVKKGIKSMRQAALNIDRDFLDRKMAMDIIVYSPDFLRKRLSLEDPFAKKIIAQGKILYEKK